MGTIVLSTYSIIMVVTYFDKQFDAHAKGVLWKHRNFVCETLRCSNDVGSLVTIL